MNTRASIAFVVLMALGLFVILYGIVSPITTGAAFSSSLVERLGLEKKPETYDKVVEIYAEHNRRRGDATALLGLFILLPSTYGLWATYRHRPHAPLK